MEKIRADSAIDPRSFLQLCLQAKRNAAARMAVEGCVAGSVLPWNAIWELAESERVGPLVYHTLRDTPGVPPPTLQRLHNSYRRTSLHNIVLLRELERALQALADVGVGVIVLKGAALAQTTYGNPALRPLQDIDVLVRRESLAAALRALTACGYETPNPETRAGVVVAYENELLLCKPGPVNVPLEIHWSLFDSPYYQYALPMNWFWETSVPLPTANGGARMLGPEAQVLHLCGHLLLHHSGDDLLWLHDIAELLANHQNLHWDVVLERAAASGLVLPVQRVVERVASEWDAPVPAAVRERLQMLRPSARERRAFAQLTAPERTRIRRLWTHLVNLPCWRQRVRFAAAYLFPSLAYMREIYGVRHAVLLPLYYPYRWLRGLRVVR